ncbi:5-adenylylsulfate reductase-like [Ranunculus cassubicifolius]
MAASMALVLVFLFLSSSLHLVYGVSPLKDQVFLNNLQSQCPISLPPSLSLEVDGEFLDKALKSSPKTVYTAILFHASWCPFSKRLRSTFDVLSAMFPQVRHLAVEQSAALPSVFSRYGIHSMPSLLLVNQAKVKHHGPKDLDSLVRFYKKTTGLEPIGYLTDNQGVEVTDKPLLDLLGWSTRKDILSREPCLIFSLLFLFSRVIFCFFPSFLSQLRAFWALYIPRLNLEIFGETSQLLGRALHVIDMKRVWNKVKLCKTRNFQERAKNARVWASSLASVSLGESSVSRN